MKARALVLVFALAAWAACGDDEAPPDASAPDGATAPDAEAPDAGSACERQDYGAYAPLTEACARCGCIACRPIIEACDDACRNYVNCLYRCEDAVEACDARCPNERGQTPSTERVTNMAICIGNLCPTVCEVPQSL